MGEGTYVRLTCMHYPLRVCENRVLRIFGPKWVEVTGDWRILHGLKFDDLYASQNIIRVIKSGEFRISVKLLVIISVGSVVTDLLWIRFSTFGRY
jgi:hypothetical protein